VSARTEDAPTSSAADLAIDAIRARLRAGLLVPGQRIIGSELAEELGISRIPVREAIHRLTGEGLIELDRNRSPRIRPVTARDLLDMLHLMAALGTLGIRLATAALAKMAEGDPARRDVERRLDSIIRAAAEREAFLFNEEVHAFHAALTELTGNRYLRSAFSGLHSEYFTRDLAPRLRKAHWQGMAENYRHLRKAMLAGDIDAAAGAYQRHMDWVICELFPELSPVPLAEESSP
jgi:DNA-binding GntR family transcriptional regulator